MKCDTEQIIFNLSFLPRIICPRKDATALYLPGVFVPMYSRGGQTPHWRRFARFPLLEGGGVLVLPVCLHLQEGLLHLLQTGVQEPGGEQLLELRGQVSQAASPGWRLLRETAWEEEQLEEDLIGGTRD